MPFDANNVTVVGNLTRDPELRFTPNGTPVVGFGVAVNRRYQNKQTNEWVEDVSFFDISAWFKLAENCAESLSKGDRVMVSGRLNQRSWETKEGDKRYIVEIVADNVGPSLQFATCKISRNEKSGGDFQKDNSKEESDLTDEDIPF